MDESNVVQMPDGGKKFQVRALIIVGVVVVALIAIFAIASAGGGTIDLNKYTTITASGADGYGTAAAEIDWASIEQKYKKKVKWNKKALKDADFTVEDAEEFGTPMDFLEEAVGVSVDPATGLKNGDTVKYDYDIDHEYFDAIDVKLKYKAGTYKVDGLSDVATYEAFDDVTVSFSGIAPNGKAEIKYSGSDLSFSDFSLDKKDGLSTGDTVTVTISQDAVDRLAAEEGKVPATIEKQYTVEGLDSYVTKLSDITDLSDFQAQAKAVFDEKGFDSFDSSYATKSLEGFDYVGDYLLTAKKADFFGDANYLVLVYKVTSHDVINKEGLNGTYDAKDTFYWTIRFSNVTLDKDGKAYADLSNYQTSQKDVKITTGVTVYGFDQSIYHYGYDSVDSAYAEEVTSLQDDYNVEENMKAE